MASGDRVSMGSESLKWYFFAIASKYIFEMPSDFTFPQPEALMPPFSMLSLRFGMMSSGSISI